ncbi:MAG: N-acetylneuraminate synthase/N,N'-diacetyllegionaminate synthase [Crocinitomicaceae bacterium]|jgi:N-acetylneuraminate synthase/N,N'-diacetyllegionaminate synthase
MSNWIGKNGPLMIAEIGGNHEGDFEYAKKLTQLAIESNVDYIKFQMYSGDSLVSPVENPVRNKHFKKFELNHKHYIELAEMCKAGGVGFMASVWNPDYFEWIDQYMDIYKIGSGDMTAYPVLEATAALGKPIILSTGLSSIDEVLDAIEFIQSCNVKYKDPEFLSVLQCTSMYPIPFDFAHLSVMNEFTSKTGLPVGYSDHTEGSYALEIAVAMGAQILEFHFTDSREGKDFRDHKVSLTRDEVLELNEKITEINKLKGSKIKEPQSVEGDHLITFRRAIYPATDLPKGTTLVAENLVYLRPNHGIDARDYKKVIGKTLTTDVKAFEKLNWSYLE